MKLLLLMKYNLNRNNIVAKKFQKINSLNTFNYIFWTTGVCLHICHLSLVVALHVVKALSIEEVFLTEK